LAHCKPYELKDQIGPKEAARFVLFGVNRMGRLLDFDGDIKAR